MIHFFDERQIRESLDWPSLVDALAAAFAVGLTTVPDRHHHRLAPQGEEAPTLLLMPAWSEAYLGVKVVTVFPGNQARHLPTVMGAYLLMSGRTGEPLAYLDAQELTARRTAATSLLAASRLARPDSSTLLVVGSGRIARLLIDAYRSWFPLQRIVVWNHRPEGASKIVREIRAVDLAGDLFTLANMKVGERKHDDVTVFKSVGHALEDLVAAITVYEGGGRDER